MATGSADVDPDAAAIAKYKAEVKHEEAQLGNKTGTLHDVKTTQRAGRQVVAKLQDKLADAKDKQAAAGLAVAKLAHELAVARLAPLAVAELAPELGLVQAAPAPSANWPPVEGWVGGDVEPEETKRSYSYDTQWPSIKRQPAFPFKGNGAYDGGKAMRKWMETQGVKPTAQQRLSATTFDFRNLEKKLVGGGEEKRDAPGQWPPTNTWVKGEIEQETDWLDPDAFAHEIDVAADNNPQEETGQWPPTAGWAEGAIATPASWRSPQFAPDWTGPNRSPSYPFKGNGQYDGGKAVRGWMNKYGVKPTRQMKLHATNFDFNTLEKEIVGDLAPKPDQPGQWPPTNTWVAGKAVDADGFVPEHSP